MKDKPKRSHHRKVVPLAKAIMQAAREPVPPVIGEPINQWKEMPISRWARFHLWIGLLPSRVRHAVAEVFVQSKDSHEES